MHIAQIGMAKLPAAPTFTPEAPMRSALLY